MSATPTIIETAIAAAEQVEDAPANVAIGSLWKRSSVIRGITAIRPIDLDADDPVLRVRSGQGATCDPEARAPVYGNRRRMRGRRGRRRMRQRGERIERSLAHLYDTGGMRRTHHTPTS